MATFRVLDKDEALTLLRLAGEHHRGKRKLPPEILEKQKEIREAIRNAEQFIAVLRVVDYGMINRVAELKVELDTLIGNWATRETPTLH